MKEPLIFVTNDDGVAARGLQSAIRVARRFGRVVAIAPERPQSGKSHSITMYDPLYLRPVSSEPGCEVYACSGTPVDCVKMAFDYMFLDHFPDLTISGINHGSNSAINVLYSGTMGAAIEAGFYGRPSIGLSLDDHSSAADFEGAELYSEQIVRTIMEAPVELPLCLNVNIPAIPAGEIKGVRICRQAQGYWKENFVCREDAHGRDYFWLTGRFDNSEPDNPETDEWALANGYVSVVPIQTDLTDHGQVTALGKFF